MNTKWLLFFLFLVVSCQGGQNPLHEYPDYIQNATLPENIPQKPLREPVSSEFARIITNDPWAIVVGQEFAMEIDAYLFLEDDMYQDFRVELTTPPPEGENYLLEEIIEDRGGYNYEAVEGEEENNGDVLKQKEYLFKWTPSQSILEEDIRKVYYLTFTLITEGEVALVRNKTIPVFISRRFEIPKITKVKLPGTMKEGETGEMTVLVEVSDSSETHPPTLQFESPSIKTHSDLRGYLSFVEKKWLENGKWEFKYFIDFPKGVDVSVSHKKHSLRVRAISSFGIQSEFKNAQTTVNNTVQDPVVVGPSDATILEGGRTNIFISAVDSTLSGEELSARLVTPIINLPGEVFLSYLPMSGGGLEISINWALPEGVENLKDSYRVEIEVENEGREGMKTVRRKKRHFVNIHVNKLRTYQIASDESSDTNDSPNESVTTSEPTLLVADTPTLAKSKTPDPVPTSTLAVDTLAKSKSNEAPVPTSAAPTLAADTPTPAKSKATPMPVRTLAADTLAPTKVNEVNEPEGDKSVPKVVTPPSETKSDDDQPTEETPEEVEEGKSTPEIVTPSSDETKGDNDQSTDGTSEEETEEDKSAPEIAPPPSETKDNDGQSTNGTSEETSKEIEEDKSQPSKETSSSDQQDTNEPSPEEGARQNEDLTTPPLSAVRIMPFYNLKERGLS